MRHLIYAVTLSIILLQSCSKNEPSQWITARNASAVNTWLCFRKTFTVSDTTLPAEATIAADSKYWLWLNDTLIIFEGQLKRGPNPNDTYCDVIDLAPYLKKGKNTMAVLVWYFGKHGFSHKSSGKAGFYLSCPGQNLGTDKSWKVMRHPAFYLTDGVQPNYRLAESNVGFDARKDIAGWFSSTYNDSRWKKATVAGVPPVKPWNKLIPRPIPMFKNEGYASYEKIEKSNGKIVGMLPADLHVTPYILLRAKAGLKIDMRTDDYMLDQSPSCASIRAEYITKEGIQEFEPLAWMNGHKVIYTIPAGVEVVDVKYRETGYNTEFAGRFLCDQDFYTLLWEKARRTVYVNMRDNYFDCPERERAQWWGDLVNEIAQTHYAFDTNALGLARKAIYNLVDWQRPDSTYYAPVPAGNWNNELPQQMLASAGFYGFWDYFMYTGDTALIRYVYPSVKKYIGVWKLDDKGLVVHRKGEWDWADWGNNIDDKLMDNAWYILLLKGASGMAQIAGSPQDTTTYSADIAKIRKAVNDNCYKDNIYRTPDYKGKTDDRAMAMMVLSGIADTSKYDFITKFLTNERRASPYMERYVLEALCMMGRTEAAMQRMKTRFMNMVSNKEISTLWEGWDYIAETNSRGTYNHGWSGGPEIILSKFVAGIAPDEPGYKSYHIYPTDCGLKEITSNVCTVRGDISFVFDLKEEWVKQYRITSPNETVVTLRIDKKYYKSMIKANGSCIAAFDKAIIQGSEGAEVISEDAKYVYVRLGSGSWVIEVM